MSIQSGKGFAAGVGLCLHIDISREYSLVHVPTDHHVILNAVILIVICGHDTRHLRRSCCLDPYGKSVLLTSTVLKVVFYPFRVSVVFLPRILGALDLL